MAYPDATIYSCSADGIDAVDYFDTEHYKVTHDFLANPVRMLDIKLSDADNDSDDDDES